MTIFENLVFDYLLKNNKYQINIAEFNENSKILISGPHHASKLNKYLKHNTQHITSDENIGYLVKYLANKLQSSFYLCNNFVFDVNKYDSDYIKYIALVNPNILIEIHGHSGEHSRNDIEISCGNRDNNIYSYALAKFLENKFNDNTFYNLKVEGDYNKIHYKASKTISINTTNYIAFHIELSYKMRRAWFLNKPPKKGYLFCDYLIEGLKYLNII